MSVQQNYFRHCPDHRVRGEQDKPSAAGDSKTIRRRGRGNIQLRRPYPQWGPIGLQEWGGKANYNSLQTELEMRAWHGLTLIGSYVFSKCLDDGTDESGPVATQLIGTNYAVCDFDQTHTGSLSFNYALPFGRGKRFLNTAPAFVQHVVGGWQLAAVTTLKSGLPFTPVITGDRANTGVGNQRPNVIGTPLVLQDVSCWFYTSSNSSCRALYPDGTDAFAVPAQYTYGNSGRNILRGDKLLQMDVSLVKEFLFSEMRRLQFRAEFFNMTNHSVLANPGTAINTTAGGQVSSTLNSNRIIEFALKLYFEQCESTGIGSWLAACLPSRSRNSTESLHRMLPVHSFAMRTPSLAVRKDFGNFVRVVMAETGKAVREKVEGPNLMTSWEVRRATDARLFESIRSGVKGTAMPAFPLPEAQVWEILAFVRSLNAPANRIPLPGDAHSGQQIFFGKGSCSACSSIDPRPRRLSWARSFGHWRGSARKRTARGDANSETNAEPWIHAPAHL